MMGMKASYIPRLAIFLAAGILMNLAAQEPTTDPATGIEVAWKVLSQRTVSDGFGRRVADQYFAVEVHLSNLSDSDLLLSGFFFRPPNSWHEQPLEPNDPYALVRSTIERDQQVGRRATMMHVVRSLGPLLSLGGALISGSVVTVSKYSASVGIFSNGIEKGLDNAYPDQTIRQLGRLDSLSFQGPLILRIEEPRAVVVFVNRAAVQCGPEEKTCAGRLPFGREFDPGAVKLRLGAMSVRGHVLAYRRRFHIETPAASDKP
jgi:hypothetical protein